MPTPKSFFLSCGWRGALRPRELLDPESGSPRALSSLRVLRVKHPRAESSLGSECWGLASRARGRKRVSPSRRTLQAVPGTPYCVLLGIREYRRDPLVRHDAALGPRTTTFTTRQTPMAT